MKLPIAESFGLTEAKEERLSQIIAEINSRTGKAYDNDIAVKVMLQIRISSHCFCQTMRLESRFLEYSQKKYTRASETHRRDKQCLTSSA